MTSEASLASDPRVYLVDDDAAVLRALQRLLAASGIASTAFDAPQRFLAAIDCEAAGCAVLDLAMPGLDGLALQQALAARGSTLPIVFLTGRGDIPASVKAMKHGAVDFLTKPVDAGLLLAAIRAAFDRDARARAERDERRSIEARLDTLTPREREVLRHLVAGRLNKQIAADLGTAEKTIKVHRARVLAKLGVRSLVDLARLAQSAGIDPAAPRA